MSWCVELPDSRGCGRQIQALEGRVVFDHALELAQSGLKVTTVLTIDVIAPKMSFKMAISLKAGRNSEVDIQKPSSNVKLT